MNVIWQWIAIAVVIIVLLISDARHLAASRFNLFLLLLLAMIAGLIILIKITHQPDREP